MTDRLHTGGAATLAEASGLTEELGRYIADLAAAELAGGRLESAREILDGLALSNPYDAAPWAMLALLHRRRGSLDAARLCAEVAKRAAPGDAQVRLVRAEILLGATGERPGWRSSLRWRRGRAWWRAGRGRCSQRSAGETRVRGAPVASHRA
jgi:tetratricopeptide (TPR) repeat protein